MGGLQQLPQQRLEHAHAVVLEVFRQMGVVARDQGNVLALGQPDATKPEHGWIHHMDEVRLEGINRLRHRWAWQGQLQLGVKRQRHCWHADEPGTHVLVRTALRTEHDHLITGFDQMPHRFGETGDDAIDLGKEGLGEEGDFQRWSLIQEAVPIASA